MLRTESPDTGQQARFHPVRLFIVKNRSDGYLS
jgi:hypothetical protein